MAENDPNVKQEQAIGHWIVQGFNRLLDQFKVHVLIALIGTLGLWGWKANSPDEKALTTAPSSIATILQAINQLHNDNVQTIHEIAILKIMVTDLVEGLPSTEHQKTTQAIDHDIRVLNLASKPEGVQP